MKQERIAHIEAIIADCEAKEIPWTNLLVYEAVGGKYGELSQYLKQRRARQAVATSVAVAEDPHPKGDEDAQDATDALQAQDESRVEACPLAVPLPGPEAPGAADEACVPVESPPRPVPKLEALQQAVRDADAALVRLTRARDVQQTVAQGAALALHQATRDAQRLVRALRGAAMQARATPAPFNREAEARVAQLQGHLAILVGEAEAAQIACDRHFTPAWLRG
jgi:hypothetical protein